MMNIRRVILSLILLVGVGAADEVERKVVSQQEPVYPEVARNMSLHGTVKLKLWIAKTGKVDRLEYIGGHPLLAEAAISAVKNWKFEAAQKDTTQVVAIKF